MANFEADPGSGGDTFASDEISSVEYPIAKIGLGDTGTAVDAVGGAGAVGTNTQRVTLGSDDPAVALLTTIDSDTNTIQGDTTTIAGAVSGTEMQVDVVAALPAGTNLVGNVKISDGTETANVNASNELQVRDDDANTDLDTIAGDTTSIDGKITACNTGAVVLTNASLIGPADPTVDSYTNIALNLNAGANQELVATPGADKQIWVYGVGFSVDTAATSVSFQDEDDAAASGIMLFAQYGGMNSPPSGNFSMPMWKIATNKALEVDLVTGGFDGWLAYGIVSV